MSQLTDHEFLVAHDDKLASDWHYTVLGEDTPPQLWTPIYSLYSALFHTPNVEGHFPCERDGFHVEQYLGIHFTEYGNYSGGRFPGLYSSFLVRDAAGEHQTYKIGFFSCAHTENDPVFGNRKGTSGIHVAIDDFDKGPHMSLELSLDTCLARRGAAYELVHDGKITVGRLGAAKRDDFLGFVKEEAPGLVRERSVVLGAIPSGRPLVFSDVSDLVFNLLHYSEVRDRFRAEYKLARG